MSRSRGVVGRPAGSTTSVRERPSSSRRTAVWIAAAYLGIASLLCLVATVGAQNLLRPTLGEIGETGVPWLDAWFRYDAGWYYGIAVQGYSFTEGQQSAVAFFPTYPIAVDGVSFVVGNVALAGVLVTLVSGLAAVLLFWRWSSRWLTHWNALVAVALLLVYPYSLYLYGAVYADALFLLSAVGAFVLLERGHPWLAGLVGALATAGRPVGMAVFVGLVIRAVELSAARHRWENGDTAPSIPANVGLAARLRLCAETSLNALRSVRPRDAGVLLSALGLIAYGSYLAIAFGHPLAFVEAQEAPGWDQGSGPRTWFKVVFIGALLTDPWDVKIKLLVPALFCLVAVLLVPRIWRRFGPGYAVYTFLMVAVPALSTKDFMGTGRYLLAAFPVFALAGELLADQPRRWPLRAALGAGAVGLVAGAYLFGTGYQVS